MSETELLNELKTCTSYIRDNKNGVIAYINEYFRKHAAEVRKKFLECFDYDLTDCTHYDWCMVNDSGKLVYADRWLFENGIIPSDITVEEFVLEFAEDNYISYGDKINDDLFDVCTEIMITAICEYVMTNFHTDIGQFLLSEPIFIFGCMEMSDAYDNLSELIYGDIYMESDAFNLSYCEFAIKYLGIGDCKMSDIRKELEGS